MTINCNGNLIDLSTPKVMGILNITPDSFFDGGKYKEEKSILAHVEKMITDGATFIDVGAYSSRPGADAISAQEEIQRILPIVRLLLREFPEIVLSIDTFRSAVAEVCLEAGAAMINDISAGKLDQDMLMTVARFKAPYIMMHMKGTPQTMRKQTDYKNLLQEVLYYFSERVAAARALGLLDVIVDPGFGFAKTTNQNYELLHHLDMFQTLKAPIITGLSRKSMIYKILNCGPEDALNGTTALNMFALTKGASILRVHDVKKAIECIKLSEQLK